MPVILGVIFVLLLGAGLFYITSGGQEDPAGSGTVNEEAVDDAQAQNSNAQASSDPNAQQAGDNEVELSTDPNSTATVPPTHRGVLSTNRGDIKFELFGNEAKETVANFTGLADGSKEYSAKNASGTDSGPFYDGSIFHRVIDGFMIQGGDPRGTGTGGPGYQFGDEFNDSLAFDKPYLLAMANAGPGTNGSQFFITVGKTPHLTGKHTIFGEVVDPASRKVVDEIAATKTGPGDRPVDEVVIESVSVEAI